MSMPRTRAVVLIGSFAFRRKLDDDPLVLARLIHKGVIATFNVLREYQEIIHLLSPFSKKKTGSYLSAVLAWTYAIIELCKRLVMEKSKTEDVESQNSGLDAMKDNKDSFATGPGFLVFMLCTGGRSYVQGIFGKNSDTWWTLFCAGLWVLLWCTGFIELWTIEKLRRRWRRTTWGFILAVIYVELAFVGGMLLWVFHYSAIYIVAWPTTWAVLAIRTALQEAKKNPLPEKAAVAEMDSGSTSIIDEKNVKSREGVEGVKGSKNPRAECNKSPVPISDERPKADSAPEDQSLFVNEPGT